MRKEKIDVSDHADHIVKMIGQGVLLNTNGDKFNSMVIAWGHIGILWRKKTFVVYVRQGRYTKPQIDKTGEFTVSIPLEAIDANINKVCGTESGYDIDKAEKAGLTLVDAEVINTPGIAEYPMTIECKVLYSQDQELEKIPEDIREAMYPQDVPGTYYMANKDFHTMYVGEIVDAYIIRD